MGQEDVDIADNALAPKYVESTAAAIACSWRSGHWGGMLLSAMPLHRD